MFSYTFNSRALAVTLLITAALLPSSVRAQRIAANDSLRMAVLAAPIAMAHTSNRVVPVGISRLARADNSGLVQTQDQGRHLGVGQNLALMGVGGAAVVIGLLVGGNSGTAIAVGGGALGLVGFYRYLR